MPDGMIGKTIEHYRIDFMLGQGGMAAVYRATDLRLQRQVAIKLMHPHLAVQTSFQKRFLQEARASAKLDHPNIIRVLTFNNLNNDLFIVMELVTGGNLRHHIKKLYEEGRIIDYPEAIELVYQMADALSYAHKQGMIHRDIKPDNVLLKPDAGGLRLNYRPILTDFGLAKLTSSSDSAVTDQQPIGTYPYMSPEQCLAEGVDQRSDIYALGVMLYELAVGRLPFNPKSIAEAARMHGREPVPPPSASRPNFPADLQSVILRALEKDPAKRYQSALEMAADLQALLRPVVTAHLTLNNGAPIRSPTYAGDSAVEMSTDLSTTIMPLPLPKNIPPDLPVPLTSAEARTHDRLVLTSANHPPVIVTFNDQRPILRVGRGTEANVILQGEKVSRMHMVIELKPNGRFTITDLKSTNGTYVGDVKLESSVPIILRPGVTLRVGDYWGQIEQKTILNNVAGLPASSEVDGVAEPLDWLPNISPSAPPPLPAIRYPTPPPLIPVPPQPLLGEISADELTPPPSPIAPPAFAPPKFVPPPPAMPTPPPMPAISPIRDDISQDAPTPPPTEDEPTSPPAAPKPPVAPVPPPKPMIPSDFLSDAPPLFAPPKFVPPPPIVPPAVISDIPPTRTHPPSAPVTPPTHLPVMKTGAMSSVLQLPESAGYPTEALPAQQAAAHPPHYTPPQVSPEQLNTDRLIFFSENRPLVTARMGLETVSIGRGGWTQVNVRLDDPAVSRLHARIERAPNQTLVIVDESSRSGVMLNGQRIASHTPTPITPEDEIRLGSYWLKVEPKGVVPINLSSMMQTIDLSDEPDADPDDTLQMIKPLDEEQPHYSPPPMTVDMQAADRLMFYSEDHPPLVVKLTQQIMTIGRAPQQDIRLEGRRVSRQHALLELKSDGHMYLTDLDSENKTWVGDTQLVPHTQVHWGRDEIARVGNYWVKFQRGNEIFDAGSLNVASDPRNLVGSRIKNFRIDRFVGQNNLTSVYKATELPLDRVVALKVMHPNLAAEEPRKQRFLQESRMLSKLDHPNIVRVLSYDNVNNELFMVMEFVPGSSIRKYIRDMAKEGRLAPLAECVTILVQIADGLHYANQQGMIHRSLKPENVVMRTSTVIGPIVKYQPVMTDFSIARAADGGVIFITDKPNMEFPYLSPEQCQGERIDIRSDIYEMGILLYEMLTGQPPFKPRSLSEAIRMHVHEPVPFISDFRSDVPEELQAIIGKMLAKNPNNRYQTAIEVARALQRLNIEGVEGESGDVSALTGVALEDMLTSYMPKPLPESMPHVTRVPSFLGVGVQPVEQLIFYSDDSPTRVLPFNQQVVTLGRADDQDVVLSGDKVSRRHLRIERGLGDIVRVIDLGSKNGTFLGGYKLISGVAETWDKADTLRVGNYWVRLELPRAKLDTPVPSQKQIAAPVAPVIFVPPPLLPEKIGVIVSSTALHVIPGQTTTLPIEVVNRSDVVDHFKVEIIGLPTTWYTPPTDAVYLLPNTRDTIAVTFHPPMTSSSAAGAHAFEVRVSARAQAIQSTASQVALEIQPFYSYTIDLEPERIKGRGRSELTISNTGNTFAKYTVQAKDREQGVRFDMIGKQFTLSPGQREVMGIKVMPRRRPWLGGGSTFPFELTVVPTPTEQSGGPQAQQGELVVKARIPAWLLALILLGIVLCGVLAAFAYTQVMAINAQNQTITAAAQLVYNDATATAIAAADDDADGLSNLREAELKTDPKKPDTDEDGLLDGEEVQKYATNPLNIDTDADTVTDGDEITGGTNPNAPDTDGDELTEGEEREIGTNPLLRDTDQDGLNDKEDPDPLNANLPTVTPFPTIPGTSGDICPGSPSPARVASGMQAVVEPGGVPNRVRAEPAIDAEVLTQMLPGAFFIIVGGPECGPDDQLRWWQVSFNGVVGWTAEGEGDEYYIAPPDLKPDEGGGSNNEGDSANSSGRQDVAFAAPVQVADLNPRRMGMQVQWYVPQSQWDRALDLAAPLDVGWIKVQADWGMLESAPGQLSDNFPVFADALRDVNARGYRVLVSVAKAPTWARTTRGDAAPPDNPQDLAAFMTLMLSEVGGSIHAVEIWNEPNLQREWNTDALPFNGAGYMRLFEPAYQAVRAYSPRITIITAGLSPTASGTSSVNDRTYLRQMYAAGLDQYNDIAIGVHPYGWGNAPTERCCNPSGAGWDDRGQFFFLDTLSAYREIMSDYDHESLNLWATEFGWPTYEDLPGAAPEAWMVSLSSAQQADYVADAFAIGQGFDFMGPMFLWNLNFADTHTVANVGELAAYSLLYTPNDQTVVERPVYRELVKRLGASNGSGGE